MNFERLQSVGGLRRVLLVLRPDRNVFCHVFSKAYEWLQLLKHLIRAKALRSVEGYLPAPPPTSRRNFGAYGMKFREDKKKGKGKKETEQVDYEYRNTWL